MALKFVKNHNMYAMLVIRADNQDYASVIRWLQNSNLNHALTASPPVYRNLIDDFWASAGYIEDNPPRIHAVVQNRDIVVTEAEIRRVLQLNDDFEVLEYSTNTLLAIFATMGYQGNVNEGQFQKGMFPREFKYIIHHVIQSLSPRRGTLTLISKELASATAAIVYRQPFNFSRLIFQGMKHNAIIDDKFLQYPRFLQMIINDLLPDVQRQGEVLQLQSPDIFKRLRNVTAKSNFDEQREFELLPWLANPNEDHDIVVPASPLPEEPQIEEDDNSNDDADMGGADIDQASGVLEDNVEVHNIEHETVEQTEPEIAVDESVISPKTYKHFLKMDRLDAAFLMLHQQHIIADLENENKDLKDQRAQDLAEVENVASDAPKKEENESEPMANEDENVNEIVEKVHDNTDFTFDDDDAVFTNDPIIEGSSPEVIKEKSPTKEKPTSPEKRVETEQIAYNYMGKTKERAWRGIDEQERKQRYIYERKWKIKQARKLLDDDEDDVVTAEPKRKRCELVLNVSSMSDSSLDDDGGGDDDGVDQLDSKQKQCELDDGGGDVELLDPKHEHHELVDNVSSMLVSLEKHSSFQSGIVYVRGYKVKQSIATILEAIFKKHGDVAANCIFKASSTRTHFLEVLCEIVRRIQTNDMTEMVEDIESQLLDAEAANINVSWLRAHSEAFHKRNETSNKFSLLMEMKSNTMLVKTAAETDLKERCQELMGAQQRLKMLKVV